MYRDCTTPAFDAFQFLFKLSLKSELLPKCRPAQVVLPLSANTHTLPMIRLVYAPPIAAFCCARTSILPKKKKAATHMIISTLYSCPHLSFERRSHKSPLDLPPKTYRKNTWLPPYSKRFCDASGVSRTLNFCWRGV